MVVKVTWLKDFFKLNRHQTTSAIYLAFFTMPSGVALLDKMLRCVVKKELNFLFGNFRELTCLELAGFFSLRVRTSSPRALALTSVCSSLTLRSMAGFKSSLVSSLPALVRITIHFFANGISLLVRMRYWSLKFSNRAELLASLSRSADLTDTLIPFLKYRRFERYNKSNWYIYMTSLIILSLHSGGVGFILFEMLALKNLKWKFQISCWRISINAKGFSWANTLSEPKRITPREKTAVLENGVGKCVHFCLRSLWKDVQLYTQVPFIIRVDS